ncbi:MAG: FtsX-like permease family protein [Bacillota bacterium]
MLLRKLWRDIRGNYGAYLACISVLVIGLMLFVSMTLMLESLTGRRDDYYREHSFADGFAKIAGGPAGLADDIGRVPGVRRVVGRIVQDVLVNRTSGEETTTLRLVSFKSENQPVNRFKLEQGKVPTDRERGMLVSPAFLEANGYRVGDRVPLIFQGREISFTITGTAKSPEYIYEIPGGQTLTPDPKAFGTAFVPYSTLAPLVGMDGRINELSFTLHNGVDFSRVKRPVSRILEHYGLEQVYPRKDQLSASMLDQEITQLKGSATTTPVIFLFVAASILYIMLRRMVEQQRGQIGILKAFGFSNREIMQHYLGYAFLIGALGGLGGSLAGTWFSYVLASLYQQYYNIPNLTGKVSLSYLAAGTLLSLAFSLIAGYQGCKGVLALNPSEAMRPPAPKGGGRTLVERVRVLWQLLSTQTKMAVRNVFRSRQRTILAILGVASAFSMMVASRAMFDATYFFIDFQYERVEKYDLKVSLQKPVDKTAGVTAGKHLDGVTGAEPVLEVPVTMSNRWLEKNVSVMGLPEKTTLYRLLTDTGKEVALPSDGLVVSGQLAKMLDIKIGDKVTVKPFLADRQEHLVTVKKIIPQYVGLGAYMEIDALSRLLNAPPVASAVFLKVDKDKIAGVRKELQGGRNVAGIYDKTKLKAQFEELMESSNTSQYILLGFAFVTGFAIVYNVNLISLSERERELATLMVLGMTEREIGRILIAEQVLLGILAIVFGIPMSYGMLYAIINASGSEIFNMPLVVEPMSITVAILGTVLFLVAAQWRTKGKIGRLSMLDVLKQQE